MAMAFDCIQSDAIIQAFKVKFFGGKAFFKLERLRPSWPSSLGRAWLINFFRENFTLKGLRGLDSLNGLADLWTNGLHRRTKAGPNCFISFLLIAIISFRRNFMPKYLWCKTYQENFLARAVVVGGQVVSVLAFNSADPALNPAVDCNFSV